MDAFVNSMTSAAAAVAGLADQINDLKLGKKQFNYYVQGLEKSAELQHKENQFWADYNTPAAQMQRLRDAGLNPNLVYDRGANAQFSGSVSPSSDMPIFRGSYGKNLISMQNMLAQNRNIEEQNRNIAADTAKKQEEKRGIELDNARKEWTNPLAYKLEWDKHLNSVSEREKNQSIALYHDAQRDLAITSNSIQKEYGYNIQEEILNNHLLENAILEMKRDNTQRMLDAEYGLTIAEKQKVLSAIANLKALSKLYEAQEKNEGKQFTLTDKKITEQHIKNEMLNLEKQVQWVKSQIETSSWSQWWNKWVGVPSGAVGHIFGTSFNLTPLLNGK